MTNAELLATIRAKIERRIKELYNDKYINLDAKACRVSELGFLKRFLDSLSVDAPEGLDEAAENLYPNLDVKKGTSFFANEEWSEVKNLRCAFKAGAEWAFGQMKEDAK